MSGLVQHDIATAGSRRTAGGLAASAFSRSEMSRQTACFPFVQGAVGRGAMVHTDGWRGYAGLAAAGYQHQVTVLSGGSDPAHEVMPPVHLVASLLKRWPIGTHQGGVQHQYLDYYLDEFTFRFNRRRSKARGLPFIASPNKPSPLDPRPTTPLSSQRVPAAPRQRGNEGDTQFILNDNEVIIEQGNEEILPKRS